MVPIGSFFSAFGLSTAAGLNAYIPLLVVGIMTRLGWIQLQDPYSLLANPIVLLVIAVLALIDFIGDKVPAVDHAFHAAGLVIHPVVGAILFVAANSVTGSVNPILAAICGLVLAGGTPYRSCSAPPNCDHRYRRNRKSCIELRRRLDVAGAFGVGGRAPNRRICSRAHPGDCAVCAPAPHNARVEARLTRRCTRKHFTTKTQRHTVERQNFASLRCVFVFPSFRPPSFRVYYVQQIA